MNETLDLSALEKALSSLHEANHVVRQSEWFNEQEATIQNMLIAGLIQNFEFVYEISIKMIKRQLEIDALIATEIDHSNFRDILRLAAEKGLINNITAWFEYRTMRNITSHTYDEDKAKTVCDGISAFLQDADYLFNQLRTRNA
ncbi:nucleotidyltransferase substrate binding protein [Necropsobacter rosorum]|uniref:nucleotidyltransferase substrate binding protein n=1 Tax=Necropsobacter rosorum TaxID=908285 RepID=UPI000509753E